jgi:hypothetical protein
MDIKRKRLSVVSVLVGLAGIMLFSCTLGGTTTGPETVTPTNTESTPTPSVTPSSTPSPTPTVVSGDFSKYSQNKQTVGTDNSKTDYKLTAVSNSDQSSFRRFIFKIEYTGSNASTSKLPNVNAEYRSDLSAIRVIVNSLNDDKSGIGFQDSVDINKNGVTRLYHAVTGVAGTGTYDVGLAKATDFYLYTKDISSGVWEVYLDVKYPGSVSSGAIDLGSTTYSKNKQTISGAKTADGAASSGYSYNSEAGVFQIVFNVQGSATKPIPDTYAEYSGGKLQMVFTDIQDIFGSNKQYDLPTVGTMRIVRSGNVSTYIFDGVTNKDFKLYGTQGPNQVILEIKL